VPQPNQLLSSSALFGYILVPSGPKLLAVLQDVSPGNNYNVTHERAIGSPKIVESVMHGLIGSIQASQLWVVRKTLNELGLIPGTNGLIGWQAWDMVFVPQAGPIEVKNKPLLLARRFMIDTVRWKIGTQSTLGYDFSGQGQENIEANEI